MTTYSRADWGAQPPRRPLNPGDPADSLVVHHVGSGATPAASFHDAAAMLRGIQQTHMASAEGYADIAYNMAVDQAGNLYILRGMDMLGAATYSANDHTRAVVWLGDSTVAPPSVAAQLAIAELYRTELGRNLTPFATITGHRDWTATACPGDPAYGLLPAIRDFASAWPTPTPTPTPTPKKARMLEARSTNNQAILLVDGLTYRVMTGTWDQVNAALIELCRSGLLAADATGAPVITHIGDNAINALREMG